MAEKQSFRERLKADYEYRIAVSALCSSALTAAVGVYYLVLALLGGSAVWCATLAAYFFALALARVAVLVSHRYALLHEEEENRRARREAATYLGCGALLELATLTLSGVIVLIVVRGAHAVYPGHLIFAAAFYAFFKAGMAIYNLVRAGKRDTLTVRALRSVNIADALVSMLSLQAALLAAFSTENTFDPNVFNAITGGIVGALVLAIGAYMIVRGARLMGRKNTENFGKQPYKEE